MKPAQRLAISGKCEYVGTNQDLPRLLNIQPSGQLVWRDEVGQPFDLFDIFKVSEDGSLLWVETAANLELARSQVEGFQTTSGCDYLVLNQKTGSKVVIPYRELGKSTVRRKHTAN